jgi:hypothetical protein
MHKQNKLGICVLCGSRVFTSDEYLEATEGYCHHNCLTEIKAV